MDEYISREALLAEIAADYGNWIVCNDTDESYHQGVKDNYSDTIRLINDFPAADVQLVKHGRWVRHGKPEDYFWNCSECKNWIIYAEHDLHKHHFCGNCGCRMDGDSE